MRTRFFASLLLLLFADSPLDAKPTLLFSGHRKLNNVVSELLVVVDISPPGGTFQFQADRDGWLFLSAKLQGNGAINVSIDAEHAGPSVLSRRVDNSTVAEGMRRVAKGTHELRVECHGDVRIDRLVIRAIPELMHCGLGFDPAIKGYGHYDLAFLKKDILPNVTTLVVPGNISLPTAVIENWHRQGKKFVAEVGVKERAKTADEHVQIWTAPFDKAPFLDGILINEFIVNQAFDSRRSRGVISPERVQRLRREQQHYRLYEEALKRIHADPR